MKPHTPPGHQAQRLDVAALAADGAEIQGEWALASLRRLAADELPTDDGADPPPVQWTARGERRPVRVGEPEIWLHLNADAVVRRECQRCLQPVALPLAVDRALRFVRGEDEAAALDADSEDDVLALERWLDLRELVEDELLLELPLVPRHETCPTALPTSAGDEDLESEPAANPFAVLQALKGKPTGG